MDDIECAFLCSELLNEKRAVFHSRRLLRYQLKIHLVKLCGVVAQHIMAVFIYQAMTLGVVLSLVFAIFFTISFS